MIDITQTIPAEQRDALLAQWDRAVARPELRRALALDAHTAIQERFGVALPDHVGIHVDPDDPGVVRIATKR